MTWRLCTVYTTTSSQNRLTFKGADLGCEAVHVAVFSLTNGVVYVSATIINNRNNI